MTEGQPQQWDRRHPDFEPGNTVAVRHGATSPRVVSALAIQIAEDFLAEPTTPNWLAEPSFRPSLMAWANAEAVCELAPRAPGEMELDRR